MNKKVFLCYDCEHDSDIKESFIKQALADGIPIHIIDTSKRHNSLTLKQELSNNIKECDALFILCGYHTKEAQNICDEFNIAKSFEKPYLLINGRNDLKVDAPNFASDRDVIYKWSVDNLTKLTQTLL